MYYCCVEVIVFFTRHTGLFRIHRISRSSREYGYIVLVRWYFGGWESRAEDVTLVGETLGLRNNEIDFSARSDRINSGPRNREPPGRPRERYAAALIIRRPREPSTRQYIFIVFVVTHYTPGPRGDPNASLYTTRVLTSWYTASTECAAVRYARTDDANKTAFKRLCRR